MIEENKRLKPIDTTPFTPFTAVTAEMAEEMAKFAEEMLPAVDALIRDIETISDGEKEEQQQKSNEANT
jgi:hypothetical protein